MSDEDGREVASLDRVIRHLFGSGLSLAAMLSRGVVGEDDAERLHAAIDGLDEAISELRGIAFMGMLHRANTEAPAAMAVAVGVDGAVAPALAVQVEGRRFLDRFEGGEPFAYAPHGHDFYRMRDHELWAHESGPVLLSARSGLALARRVGSVFQDIESRVPIYQERFA